MCKQKAAVLFADPRSIGSPLLSVMTTTQADSTNLREHITKV